MTAAIATTAAARLPMIRQLGRADYLPTWQAMRDFTARRDSDTPDELWIVEHPPVFTLGQAGRREALIDAGDIGVVATDRGGQVTYHGPGQVVIYTLLDLRRLGIFIKELVYRIEQSVIQTLTSYGIDGRRVAGAPGIYVPWPNHAASPDPRGRTPDFTGLAKIAALGIKVTHSRCYHGVAFNVAMDLAPFARIDPCGYAGLSTVDLATLGVATSWIEAADRLASRLAHHFAR